MSEPKSESELLAENLATKTMDRKKAAAIMRRISAIYPIAVRAVYEAAAGGNVTCKEAFREIEKILRKNPL